jgi:hypothetical protein
MAIYPETRRRIGEGAKKGAKKELKRKLKRS